MNTASSVQVTCLSLCAMANIVLNSLVMIVIARTPTLREDRTTLFMFSLATSDLAFGVCIMTSNTVLCSHPGIRSDAFVSILGIVAAWLTLTSLYNLCSVSVCKMVVVAYPLRCTTLVTERRCYFVIFVNWAASFVLASPLYMVDITWSQEMCFVQMERVKDIWAYAVVLQVAGGIVPLAVMVFANCSIFVVIVRVLNRVAAQGTHISENNTTVLGQHTLVTSMRQRVRASRNIIIICSVYILLVTVGITVTNTTSIHDEETLRRSQFVVLWLFFSNTFVNSLLYIVLHRSVRAAVKDMLRWRL